MAIFFISIKKTLVHFFYINNSEWGNLSYQQLDTKNVPKIIYSGNKVQVLHGLGPLQKSAFEHSNAEL